MFAPTHFQDFIRRSADAAIALIGLFLLSPYFVLIAIWIKLDSPGPIFYRALRVGQNGALFHLYKFRSMVADVDENGPAITAAGDSRITFSGRFLRKTKLDELPQLFNVLCGDISFVGPRPEDPNYVALYTEEQRKILTIRPGITSPASLKFRYEQEMLASPDWEEFYCKKVMPRKLAIDLEYMAQRSISSDMLLILKTVQSMFVPQRRYEKFLVSAKALPFSTARTQ